MARAGTQKPQYEFLLVEILQKNPAAAPGAAIESWLHMTQSNSIICLRSFEFASRALRLCERLNGRGPSARHLANQLMRCGTSIGANAEEAQEGQSKADFIAKLSVSRKEAREAGFWLRLAVRNEIVTAEEVDWELNEARQLLAMIRSAILTARSSENRNSNRST